MKLTTKTIGAIIKINRRRKRLSQQQLSQGVCAPSYLSKIENGEIEASQDLLLALLNALNIQYLDEEDFINKETKIFQKFHELATGFFVKEAIDTFDSLYRKREKYLRSCLIIEYYLAEFAVYALRKETHRKKAQELLCRLDEIHNLMGEKTRYFFYLYKSLYQRENAIDLLSRALNLTSDGYLYYLLSEYYFQKTDYLQQITNLEKAQLCYLSDGNFRGIVITKHYLGIAHFTTRNYTEALKCFLGTIKILDTAGTVDDYIFAFKYFAIYNIAEIHYFQKKYELMEEYCALLIEQQKKNPEVIYSVMPYLLMAKYKLQNADPQTAKKYLLKGQKLVDNVINFEKEIEYGLLELLAYMLENPDYLKSETYQNLLLQFKKTADESGLHSMTGVFDAELVEFYVHNRRYKDAFLLVEKRFN